MSMLRLILELLSLLVCWRFCRYGLLSNTADGRRLEPDSQGGWRTVRFTASGGSLSMLSGTFADALGTRICVGFIETDGPVGV